MTSMSFAVDLSQHREAKAVVLPRARPTVTEFTGKRRLSVRMFFAKMKENWPGLSDGRHSNHFASVAVH